MPNGLFIAVSSEDNFGLLETMGPIDLFDFHSHIANLASHAEPPFDERVDLFDGLQR
jgi:hypothetical protein